MVNLSKYPFEIIPLEEDGGGFFDKFILFLPLSKSQLDEIALTLNSKYEDKKIKID